MDLTTSLTESSGAKNDVVLEHENNENNLPKIQEQMNGCIVVQDKAPAGVNEKTNPVVK